MMGPQNFLIYITAIWVISLKAVWDSVSAFRFCTFGRFHMEGRNFRSSFRPSSEQSVLDRHKVRSAKLTTGTNLFMSGYGIATNYSWKEGAYEIDVTISVPTTTRANDVVFKATSRSIDLRLVNSTTGESLPLLDGTRKLRGRIDVDGTYWVISDAASDSRSTSRHITVTIEKIIATPKDGFDIIDYDWNGVYHAEDVDEVIERKYDQPEPLDVRQYAAEMGVDIDNLNMSLVDKNLFNSGLNLTKSALKSLHQSGYLSTEEVTQQADGTEYIINKDGEAERVDNAPVMPTAVQNSRSGSIPFIDTDSQWIKASATSNETVVQLKRNFTRAAFADDSSKPAVETAEANPFRNKKSDDPIEALTVARLKEILKAQGLKTSGTKSELQERLRNKVNALLQGNDQ